MLTGSFVALVTPFRNGKVDFDALEKLVEFHVASGTAGLVPCGTTGEAATLARKESEEVIRRVVEFARNRIPVIAGTGSNSTRRAIEQSVNAQKAGASALLVVTPYYNKPTQEGLKRHYEAIAAEVDIPIILYNVPGRTGVNLLPETVGELAENKRFAGIKEASGSVGQVSDVIAAVNRKDFAVLSGDDSLTLAILAIGGRGVVSVAANIVPDEVARLVSRFMSGDVAGAREVHERLMPLFRMLFVETNPIPIKAAMSMMGVIDGELRLPLTALGERNATKLREVLKNLGLLKKV